MICEKRVKRESLQYVIVTCYYGLETRALTKRQEAELEVADVWIVIGNEQNVRIRCEYIRGRAQGG